METMLYLHCFNNLLGWDRFPTPFVSLAWVLLIWNSPLLSPPISIYISISDPCPLHVSPQFSVPVGRLPACCPLMFETGRVDGGNHFWGRTTSDRVHWMHSLDYQARIIRATKRHHRHHATRRCHFPPTLLKFWETCFCTYIQVYFPMPS